MSRESSGLWGWLRGGWSDYDDKLDYTRVENSASSGMPDVEGHFHNQFWLELKVARRGAGGIIEVPHLRPKQIEWLYNRWWTGGRAWLLLRLEHGKRRGHFLLPGTCALPLSRGMYQYKDLVEFSMCEPEATPVEILLAAAVVDRK